LLNINILGYFKVRTRRKDKIRKNCKKYLLEGSIVSKKYKI